MDKTALLASDPLAELEKAAGLDAPGPLKITAFPKTGRPSAWVKQW